MRNERKKKKIQSRKISPHSIDQQWLKIGEGGVP
jgi:hypothetical protein